MTFLPIILFEMITITSCYRQCVNQLSFCLDKKTETVDNFDEYLIFMRFYRISITFYLKSYEEKHWIWSVSLSLQWSLFLQQKNLFIKKNLFIILDDGERLKVHQIWKLYRSNRGSNPEKGFWGYDSFCERNFFSLIR